MEDLIKREKVFEHIKAVCLEGDGGALITSEDFLKMAIKGIPSAEKQGEWLFKEITDDYHVIGQCSVCKERRRVDNFCPNCGARMKGADDETD